MRGYSKNHHAYVVETGGISSDRVVEELSKHIGTEHDERATTHVRLFFDTLLVEHTADIISIQKKKSRRDEHRFFYIGFNAATREAQSALLKTLEEPGARTSFLLLVPSAHILLDTVLSRCVRLPIDTDARKEPSFIAMNYKDRLKYVQDLLEEKDRLAPFFTQLEKDIDSLFAGDVHKENIKTPFRLLAYKRAILNQSSASKYLLEELALILPTQHFLTNG